MPNKVWKIGTLLAHQGGGKETDTIAYVLAPDIIKARKIFSSKVRGVKGSQITSITECTRDQAIELVEKVLSSKITKERFLKTKWFCESIANYRE